MEYEKNKVDDLNEIKKALGAKRGFNEPLIRPDNEEGYNLIHNSNQEHFELRNSNTINTNDKFCFSLCSRFVFVTSVFVAIVYSVAVFTIYIKR